MIGLETLATIASLVGVSAKEFIQQTNAARKHLDNAGVRKKEALRAEKLTKFVKEGRITRLLSTYYADTLPADVACLGIHLPDRLVRTSVVAPSVHAAMDVALQTAAEECRLITTEPLRSMRSSGIEVPPLTDVLPQQAVKIITAIEVRGRRVWDAYIYRLKDYRADTGHLMLAFDTDRFMRYRLTLGALFDEVVDALAETEGDVGLVLSERERRLPLRQHLIPTFSSFAELDRLICSGGVTVTFAMARGAPFHDFAIPIQRRSTEVSSGQGQISVVPQAFHQPMIDPDDEVSISATVFRELYEELFAGADAEKDVAHVRPDWFFSENMGLRWFRENTGYRAVATALARNLLNANYECAVLLVVTDPGYWESFSAKLITSWEANDIKIVSTRDPNNKRRPLVEWLADPGWESESLISFWRAIQYLTQHFPDKVDSPVIKM